jgi:hypothetical protein
MPSWSGRRGDSVGSVFVTLRILTQPIGRRMFLFA